MKAWSDLHDVRSWLAGEATPNEITIREVGLRDGLQLERPISLRDKLTMLESLVDSGLSVFEVTSFVSPRSLPALADADQLARELGRWPDVAFSALALNQRGVERAIDSGILSVDFTVSASTSHSISNTGMSTSKAIAEGLQAVDTVRQAGGRFELVIATAWDCPFEGSVSPQDIVDIVEQFVRAGVDRICLADTIGTVTPLRLVRLLEVVAQAGIQSPSLHLHNTYGAASANVLTALRYGVNSFDASIGGLGGCPFAPGASGNLATEAVVYLLEECAFSTGISLDSLIESASLVEGLVGHQLESRIHLARAAALGRQST